MRTKKHVKKTTLLLLLLCAGFINAQVPSYVPTNGLVAYYPFTGNANDASGNNHNGTVNGATLTTDRFGNANSSYNFTGTTNDITLANSQNLVNGSFSVSAWCTIDVLSPSNYDALLIGQFNGQVANDRKWLFGYRSISTQRGISYYLCNNSGNCSDDISYTLNWSPQVSIWYNITWVFDAGKSIKTYVNGILHSDVSLTLTNFNNTANNVLTKIGNGIDIDSPAKLPWNGKIDDVGIWNRTLTQDEITNLYNSTNPPLYGNVLYLKNNNSMPINAGEWNYVVISKDNANKAKVYQNGKLVYAGDFANVNYSWNRINLGAYFYTSYDGWFDGWIDEVRVSNKVRTDAEISNNYASNSALPSDSNTIGLWHFDQTSGTNIVSNVGPAGSSTNAIWDSNGRFGQCLYYNGNNALATLPLNVPTSNMTIEFWVKAKTLKSSTVPVSLYGMNTTNFYIGNVSSSATISSDKTSFCAGSNAQLTSSISPAGTYQYQWSKNGTDIIGATSSSYLVTAGGSYMLKVINDSAVIASNTITIAENPLPSTPVISSSGTTTFCSGGSVVLTSPDATGYLWSNGATSQAITVVGSGNYSVTVSDVNNCKSTSQSVPVTVKQSPTVAFASFTVAGKEGTNVDLSANVSVPGSSLQWQTNVANLGWTAVPANNYYAGVATNVLKVNAIQSQNHLQEFRLIATSGDCSTISDVVKIDVENSCNTLLITTTLGLPDSNVINTVTIYPNPAKDHITIDCGNIADATGYQIQIFNVLGQTVFSGSMNTQQYNVSLGNWGGTGVYLVKILDASSKEVNTKKIIIE